MWNPELESRLRQAAVTEFPQGFMEKTLKRLGKPTVSPQGIWNSLIDLGRPVLVSASMLAIVMLLLHLFLSVPVKNDIFELTDLSFDISFADASSRGG